MTNQEDKSPSLSLSDQVARFPESPGVYLMKNRDNTPLYIGKALNLRNRVRSYFLDSHDDRPNIPVMLKKVDHIDWIATNAADPVRPGRWYGERDYQAS